MKNIFLASILAISTQAHAYVPASVSELTGREGIFESDLGNGKCKIEEYGDDILIRTNVTGLEKIMIADVHELTAINNSQYVTIKKRTRLCPKSKNLSKFREIISTEPDSIYLTHDFSCAGERKIVEMSCRSLK